VNYFCTSHTFVMYILISQKRWVETHRTSSFTMKNLLYILPLFLLFACGDSGNSNNAATTATAPVNVGDYETTAIPGVDGYMARGSSMTM